MRRITRLTERNLHRIIKESVKRLLREENEGLDPDDDYVVAEVIGGWRQTPQFEGTYEECENYMASNPMLGYGTNNTNIYRADEYEPDYLNDYDDEDDEDDYPNDYDDEDEYHNRYGKIVPDFYCVVMREKNDNGYWECLYQGYQKDCENYINNNAELKQDYEDRKIEILRASDYYSYRDKEKNGEFYNGPDDDENEYKYKHSSKRSNKR
jgi:hypothetical protein